jgi:hypothetical protein
VRILSVGVVTAIALTFVESGFGADTVAWGSPVNALRLGIAFGSDPSKLTLRVLLQNVASDFETVRIGHEEGGTFYDSMKFIATLPTGEEREGVRFFAARPMAGRVLPVFVRLNTGATHELEFTLSDIIYSFRTTVTLDTLLKQGCSVRVRFEGIQPDPKNFPNFDWPSPSGTDQGHAWVGVLNSAEISPLR